MVQEEKITFRRREVRKPAADGASPFRELTRKDQMEFGAPEQKGRAHGRFPTADASRSDSEDRKSTRLNSSHGYISYAAISLKKKEMRIKMCSRHFNKNHTTNHRKILQKMSRFSIQQ